MMTTSTQTAPIDFVTAFNAVKYSPRDVAATFVAPPFFDKLLTVDNVVLSGPRGSGKTTLLKMLQPEALDCWDDEIAPDVRHAVVFSGIFIGADRAWNAQLSPQLPPDTTSGAHRFVRDVATSTFTTHVFARLTEGMHRRIHGNGDLWSATSSKWGVRLGPADERRMADILGRLFVLQDGLPTLLALRDALTDRALQLGTYRRRGLRTDSFDLPPYVDLPCVETVARAVERFNAAVNQPDHRWALLFDELEMAPDELVADLLTSLRAHHSQLVFKLALAPMHRSAHLFIGPRAPVPGQDFEPVSLTYARKRPAVAFGKAFLRAHLEAAGVQRPPPAERVLGQSIFDSVEDPDQSARPLKSRRGAPDPYRRDSDLWKAFSDLARTDRTFGRWLADHKLDLKRLESLTPTERASKLRKIRNLVVARDFFLNRAGSGRSRKTLALYTGADALLTLPDGNPRLLTALIRELFPPTHLPRGNVTPESQSIAVQTIMSRFLALVSAQEAAVTNGKSLTVKQFTDYVGRGLSHKILKEPFNDNVPCTFRLDREAHPVVHQALTQALNVGAVVPLTTDESERLSSTLYGQRFRLSYLLAPYYHLPLRLGRDIAVSELLPRTLRLASHRAQASNNVEPSLFDFDTNHAIQSDANASDNDWNNHVR